MKQDLKPTRAELRDVKRRLAVARRGRQLLKRKQEAMMVEFFRGVSERRAIAGGAEEAMQAAAHAIARAEAASSRAGVWSYALTRAGAMGIEPAGRAYMGAHLPDLKPGAMPGATARLLPGEDLRNIVAGRAAEESLRRLIALAAVEARLRILLDEIERTKRRVNALELRVTPQLEADAKFIQSHLDEMEREGLFTLKRVREKTRRGA